MQTHHRARLTPLRKRGIAALLTSVSVFGVTAVVPAVSSSQTASGGTVATAAAPQVRASASRHVRSGRKVVVKGHVAPGQAGRTVVIQAVRSGKWRGVTHTRTKADGAFRAVWRAYGTGRLKVRARLGGTSIASRSLKVTLYRPVQASWYGPGFYGHRTACGGTLSAGKLGVANKTLPCGTKVSLRYRGRAVTVPVIDRGPYSGNRVYDLTAATKHRLGFGSTGVVWSSR
ncbi:MAG: rare lipoprotein [Thermoleophilaceae bacterium]|jgi:rare lipoprotein A|nr:rare lipoprotein [Thermoleophilaceae bacterium]